MPKQLNYYKLMNDVESIMNEYQNDPEIGTLLKSFNSVPSTGSATIVFDGDIGAKYRIVVPYSGKLYVVAWFQVSKDGSIYFGVRKQQTEKRKTGRVKSENGEIVININEEYLPPLIIDSPTKDRFSFHGSGEIHSCEIGYNSYRPPIRETTEQNELFGVAFEKITNFDEILTLRNSDIRLMLNVSENQMLMLRVYIAPTDKVHLIGINEGSPHFFVIINFSEADTVLPLSLLLVFSLIFAEPSPPDRTIVFWPTCNKSGE